MTFNNLLSSKQVQGSLVVFNGLFLVLIVLVLLIVEYSDHVYLSSDEEISDLFLFWAIIISFTLFIVFTIVSVVLRGKCVRWAPLLFGVTVLLQIFGFALLAEIVRIDFASLIIVLVPLFLDLIVLIQNARKLLRSV